MHISNRNPKEQVWWTSWYGCWRYGAIDLCVYQTATPKNKSGGGDGMGAGDMQDTGGVLEIATKIMGFRGFIVGK